MRISSDATLYRCSRCGQHKLAAEFSFADESRRLLNAYCRTCHADYRHAHYLANKPEYVRRAIAQVKGRRQQNRQQVLAYLATHPCVDCGNQDPVVLEFDHRVRTTKLTEISRMIPSKRWARVL